MSTKKSSISIAGSDKKSAAGKLKQSNSIKLKHSDKQKDEQQADKDPKADKDLKAGTTTTSAAAADQDPEDKFKKFKGEGVTFKAKLIGSELVMEPRGDKMCQNSIQRLKAIIKGQKVHKQRIVMKISYSGVKVYDEKTNEVLYHHEVPQISFVASDDSDSRTFGYVGDVPNKAHQFICFKTSGPALPVMSVISSLFEAVQDQKNKRQEDGVDSDTGSNETNESNNQNGDNNNSTSKLTINDTSDLISSTGSNNGNNTDHDDRFSSPSKKTTKPDLRSELDDLKDLRISSKLDDESPFDLIGASDSGIMDSTFSDWLPSPHHQQHQQHQNQQPAAVSAASPIATQRTQPTNFNSSSFSGTRPGSLMLSGTPPATATGLSSGAAAASNKLYGAQNRSLIYNHSSVSLNDAALSNRSTSLVSPPSAFGGGAGSVNQLGGLARQDSTDKYAVFNDIDALPSIFESTSSLGSTTKLSNLGQSPSSNTMATGHGLYQYHGAPPPPPPPPPPHSMPTTAADIFGPMARVSKATSATGGGLLFESNNASGAFSSPPTSSGQLPMSPMFFGGLGSPANDQQYQQQQQRAAVFSRPAGQQFPHKQHHHHQPTPSMMVSSRQRANNDFLEQDSNMIVGSAPMHQLNHQQMSQHARFSSSMVAGLHQRLGSSAASIQSAGSAGGLSRQTNPFDDDFFA